MKYVEKIKKADPLKIISFSLIPSLVWLVFSFRMGFSEMLNFDEESTIVSVKVAQNIYNENYSLDFSKKTKKAKTEKDKREEALKGKGGVEKINNFSKISEKVKVADSSNLKKKKVRKVKKRVQKKKEEKNTVSYEKKEVDPYKSFKWGGTKGEMVDENTIFIPDHYKATFAEDKVVNVKRKTSAYIINKEDILLKNGDVIKRNTIMNGHLTQSGNTLYVNVSYTYKKGNKTLLVKFSVFGLNMLKGLMVQDMGEMMEEIQDDANNALSNIKSNLNIAVPFIGSLSLPVPSRVRKNQVEVFISSETEFYLKEIV